MSPSISIDSLRFHLIEYGAYYKIMVLPLMSYSIIYHELQVFPERQGKWKATTQSREFIKSIKRYYSNAYTDGEKQDAINL